MHKSAPNADQTRRSQPYATTRPTIVIKVRLLTAVQTRPRPSGRDRRRARRTAHSLAGRADRVLRNPRARRGMDLPLPRRRPGLGYHRTSCPAAYLTRQPGRVHRPRWGTRRAGTQHRRGPRLGPRHRPGRARPRPTPTRNPASLARCAPHHLKPKPSNTHTTFARYSSSASKSPRPHQNQTSDRLPGKNRRATFRGCLEVAGARTHIAGIDRDPRAIRPLTSGDAAPRTPGQLGDVLRSRQAPVRS